MNELWLSFTLQSEASFSRGDGVPGVVDVEVNHDRDGFPFLGGRTLKGLLHAEATEIKAALERSGARGAQQWAEVADRLFGWPGSGLAEQGILHVGDATLPDDLRHLVAASIRAGELRPAEVLETLTTIRRQTAVDAETGAPQEETLRAVRVILRETSFAAPLRFTISAPSDDTQRQDELAFLAACTRAFRRAGSNKTRGYGRLQAELRADPAGPAVTDDHLCRFKEAIQP